MLLGLPGVYPPQEDTWLLAEAMSDEKLDCGTRVLDICTGSGALSVAAASFGARDVTAVDISRRALVTTWINSRLRRMSVRVVHGI